MRVTLKLNDDLLHKVEEISGENVYACYQCGKCSAGCPMVAEMDLLPNQLIRCLQIGASEVILNKRTIWLCASCFTCAARCPKGVSLSRLMEGVRLAILRQRNDDEITPPEMVKEELPQIALISAMRKFTC